ncbi:hypothetical protein BLNAU_4682 [Blattamonas nauphoetae]|uniref:Uncharacterized protein n=1 Tax=Blattamonas nauphoetae TaxID=2049346 RepID=A0ABQ9Y9Q5_9EUKA|nr:hypothetical protein BLNAU_4682 [Blattamonas nauphoetae]
MRLIQKHGEMASWLWDVRPGLADAQRASSIGEDDDRVFGDEQLQLGRTLLHQKCWGEQQKELCGEDEGTGREEAEAEEASEHRSSVESFPHPSSLGYHQAWPELVGPMDSEEVRPREWKEGDGEDESESRESVHLVLLKEAMEWKLRCSSDSLERSGEESSWYGDWGDVGDENVSDWSGFEDETSGRTTSVGEQTLELTSFPADRTTRSRTTPNTPLRRKRKPKQPEETRIILSLLLRDRKVQTATEVRKRQSRSPKRSGRMWWKRKEKEETPHQRRFQLPLLDIGNVVAEDFETGPDAARFGSTPRLSTVLGKRGNGGEDTLLVELAQTDRFSVLIYRTHEWEDETARAKEGEMSEKKRNVRPLSSLEGEKTLDNGPPFFCSDTAEIARREWASHPTPQVVSALDSPQFATPVSSRRGSKKENEGEMEDTMRTL